MRAPGFRVIVNHMVKCSPRRLDRTFAALADPTRRRILEHLALGDRCVTDLARPYRMSLPAVSKHLRVLEKAGLVHRRLRLTWQWENYAMPDSVITVEFEDLGKATRVTLTHAGLPDQEDAADHNRGWSSLADKFVRVMEQHQLKPAANK